MLDSGHMFMEFMSNVVLTYDRSHVIYIKTGPIQIAPVYTHTHTPPPPTHPHTPDSIKL